MAHRVLLLPGIVMPAAAAYAELLAELGDDVDAVAEDLAVYASDSPPTDYSLDLEVEEVRATTDARGWDRFHLVGYSGGASVALACAAAHGDRLASLALLEPAWAGNWDDASPAHRALWPEYARLSALPPEEAMPAFQRIQLRPGVSPPPPPPGPPPPWMARRPAGIRALVEAFRTFDLDREALRRFDRPVYFALGGRSNPDQFEEEAERLGRVFPDFRLEVFPDRHHFDPPHRAEASSVARSLRRLWDRAGVT
ncbi:alpha/beta fold hydrolase [Nocardioides sp. GXQ0305]|uniref:alpha/beta fold hydrolase n=1 Tax=Nocardioides sp. GXQ0305 TaxID=3423912 RepID=UPI003D7CB715